MKKLIIIFCFIGSVASATRLENVKILDISPGPDNFELKLQTKEGAKDSYFLVDVTKSDPDSFKKLAHVIKKLMQGEKYKLNLNIVSFSPSPSGSYYKSEGLTFYGELAGTNPRTKK